MTQPNEKRDGAQPLCKWPGGKRWLAPTLVPIMRAHLAKTKGTYREPFLGGGALALALGHTPSVLSDACPPLVNAFKAVQRNAVEVHAHLSAMCARGTGEDAYYVVRADFNAAITGRVFGASQAARFLYLMTYGYNGVYRCNRSGHYNVPYGKDPEKTPPALDHLLEVQIALRGQAVLQAQDFEGCLRHAQGGDIVFVDPPYAETFDGYTEDGFSDEDQERLAQRLHELAVKGAAVLGTNADTPRIRALYSWATLEETGEERRVRPHGDRGRAPCLLIRAGV